MPPRWNNRQMWWANHRNHVIVGVIIVVILILAIWVMVSVSRAPMVTKKPAPAVVVAPTPAVKEYPIVFEAGSEPLKPSDMWVFPSNTKGWIVSWEADDLTIPYEVTTEEGTFRCIPGETKTQLAPTRSIGFRTLTDTTLRIRATLRRP